METTAQNQPTASQKKQVFFIDIDREGLDEIKRMLQELKRQGAQAQPPAPQLQEVQPARLFEALEDYWARRFVDYSNLPGLVAAILADVPALMIGPPGTAKTMQAMEMARVLGVDFIFSQLNPFLTPESLFGILNPAALAQGRVEVITEGYATQSRPFVWLIDEVSRAGPAVAALLLSAINERRIRYYGIEYQVRAVAILGTSNFYPEEEEVRAFLDRFAVRLFYQYVQNKTSLIKAAFTDGAARPQIPLDLVTQLRVEVELRARRAAQKAEKLITNDVQNVLEKSNASDRRLVQAWRVAAALSVYYDEPDVTPMDVIDAFVYTLPNNAAERDKLRMELLQTGLAREYREFNAAVITVNNLVSNIERPQNGPDELDIKALNEAVAKVKAYAIKMGRRARAPLAQVYELLKKVKMENI
jgi:MoxR-like ATPase